MRKEVRTIQPTEPASMAKELFRRYDIHHLVVVDKKNVVGVVADRDLMDVDADTTVQRAMAHPPVTITPDETVRKAAALMTGLTPRSCNRWVTRPSACSCFRVACRAASPMSSRPADGPGVFRVRLLTAAR